MDRSAIAAVAAASALLVSTLAHGANGPPRTEALQVRLGAFFPAGDGQLWNENEEVFTLDVSDFNEPILGFSFVHSISNNVEIGANIDFYDETVLSQYRDFVDELGFPILHDTRLELTPLTVDVRFLPFGRHRIRPGGRQVLQPVFYIGGGIGLTYWEYEEVGDFLDFTEDPPIIFPGRFKDSDAAFEVHGLAGVELPLGRRTNLLFEGRYTSVDDQLRDDFAGLGEIDLGGASIHAGVSVRF